jgi:hypothetical protein
VDCIELAEDKNKWRAVVDRLKKKKKLGISWLAEELLASQEELCSTECLSIAVGHVRLTLSTSLYSIDRLVL